jgi:hypothetical protein
LCTTDASRCPPKADHLPILSTFDITPQHKAVTVRRNWRKTDWESFRTKLTQKLQTLDTADNIQTIEELNQRVAELETAINSVVNTEVPLAKSAPHTKRWWTPKLSKAHRDFQKLNHRAFRRRATPDDPIHEAYHKGRNAYSELIKKTKDKHWKNWLEDADNTTIWDINKLVNRPSSDGRASRIPDLKKTDRRGTRTLRTSDEKAQAFFESFFPAPAPRALGTNDPAEYPDPVTVFENISDQQISRAIDKLKPYKAVMVDDIANVTLKKTKDIIIPHLGPIYHTTFILNTYPQAWKR